MDLEPSTVVSESTAHQLAQSCSRAMHAKDYVAQELGMSLVESSPGHATMTMTVRRDMLNGHAVCHGGIIFALADTVFAHACNSYNDVSLATSCTIDFLAPAPEGDQLTATARERARRKRTGVYDVEVCNEDGEVIAIFRGKSHATGKPMIPESHQ